MIPTVNFSGLLVPVSSLTGAGRAIGLVFPAAWFQPISVGTFTKGTGLFRSLVQCARPCGIRAGLSHCRSFSAAEARELRCLSRASGKVTRTDGDRMP